MRLRFPVLVWVILLAACSQNGGESSRLDKGVSGTAVPQAIQVADLPDVSLLGARIRVNGDDPQPMPIVNNQAQLALSGLPLGRNVFEVEFIYESAEYGVVVLADAIRTITLTAGNNPIVFADEDFQYPDLDADSLSNLLEISSGTHPGDESDPPIRRQWGTAVMIEMEDLGEAQDPSMTMDAGGNALVVWSQSNGFKFNIWANRLDASRDWGVPTLIGVNADDAVFPRVAGNASGNAIAHWMTTDAAGNTSVWATVFNVETGWDSQQQLIGSTSTPQPFVFDRPAAGIDANGNGQVVWTRTDGGVREVWSRRYVAGFGWEAVALVGGDNVSGQPAFALGPGGTGLAIWTQGAANAHNVRANRFDPATGWETAVSIEALPVANAQSPAVALDQDGNGLALWIHTGDEFSTNGFRIVNLWSNRFDAADGWRGETLISTGDPDVLVEAPIVAMNSQGAGLATWRGGKPGLPGIPELWSNRYDPSAGWMGPDPVTFTETVTFDFTGPGLGISNNGQALMIWSQTFGGPLDTGRAWSRHFTPTAGWDAPTIISPAAASGHVNSPDIKISPRGEGVAVWAQSDGTRRNIWANRYQ